MNINPVKSMPNLSAETLGKKFISTIKRFENGEVSRVESSIYSSKSNKKVQDVFQYPNGAITSWEYDQQGNITKTTKILENGLTTIG